MLRAVAPSGTDPLQMASTPAAEAWSVSVSTSVWGRLAAILEGHAVCIEEERTCRHERAYDRGARSCLYASSSAFWGQTSALTADRQACKLIEGAHERSLLCHVVVANRLEIIKGVLPNTERGAAR